jgi:hypothetical protein
MLGKTIWSSDMDTELIKLYSEFNNRDIAQKMGLGLNHISYRAKLLGLKKTQEQRSKCLRIDLSPVQISFIKANYKQMSNPEIARVLGLKLELLRKKIYELGLLRMKLEYWTEEQILFLKQNYQIMGDLELSEICEEKWPKNKKWTIKHIEKKRLYLNLKRTPEELAKIKQRNIDNGRFISKGVSKWLSKGFAEDGDIRMRYNHYNRKEPKIKVNGTYVNWARHAWEQNYGPIPKGMCVSFKDNDPENTTPENLELLTRNELAIKGVKQTGIKLTDNYVAWVLSIANPDIRSEIKQHPELIELKRQQLLLQRTIKQHGKEKSKSRNRTAGSRH